ncbi:TPA: restriction endonuclease subunit S [Vibrio vulnificus]|nr:restriction endonuclease subunit S [Vibrio vulnificus]
MTVRSYKFKDIARVVTGGTPKKHSENYDGDIPFVTPGDLGEVGVISSTLRTLTRKGADSIRPIPEGSVMVCCIGATVGKVGITSKEVATNQQINSLVVDQSIAYPKYVYYFCKTLKDKLMAASSSTTMPIVNKTTFSELEIPLPPLDEQKRIAAILDKADAIRQKRKQAIALADEFLRSVFLEMFGSDLVRDSNRVNFGDVTVLDAKMVDPRQDEYLDLLHIGPDRIQKNTGKLLPALTAREEGLISKKFFFNNQYVLYSKIRPYLRKAAIPEFSALCSADMYPVKPIEGKATREFIWMLLLSDLFDNYVASLPDRANIPKLNKKELAAFEFSLPEFEKVKQFSQIVKQNRKGLHSMEVAASTAEINFNALSQKAFSGQL